MPADVSPARILIADDQPDVLTALRMLLEDAGYAVDEARSPDQVMERLGSARHHLLLMDLNYARDTTSGDEGVELIRRVRAVDQWIPVVVMTAFGSVDVAVRVMREGAGDFVEKPWDNYRLLSVVRGQLGLARSERSERALQAELRDLRGDDTGVVAESAAMREVLATVERLADSAATVLITGENGVGKGVIASALHRASDRAERPLLTVDLGTLSGGLVEAELFGHEAGAFTDAKGQRVGRFELADGGTLLLDEIANCPLNQQSRLLRVIETGEFERLGSSRTRHTDVRLLCATNADLREEVRAGRFRRDLLYRINTVEIAIPPLRERREDIMPLAEQFLARQHAKARRGPESFSDEARAALSSYDWPGNVRELSHAIERAILFATSSLVGVSDLKLHPSEERAARSQLETLTLDEAEKELILRALSRHDGNVREAAPALGLSRSALYRRLQRHGLSTGEGELDE